MRREASENGHYTVAIRTKKGTSRKSANSRIQEVEAFMRRE